MSYFTSRQLKKMKFKSIGKNVLISKKTSIIKPEEINIGDNSRIDDFSLLYGSINIGRNVHITPMCLIGAGNTNITIGDFCTLAYGVKVFSQSDDYTDGYMTGSTVDIKLKKDTCKKCFGEPTKRGAIIRNLWNTFPNDVKKMINLFTGKTSNKINI